MADQNGKPRRLWQIVLVCSLALNLAVAGVVVGVVASGRIGDGPPRSFDLGVGPVARALAPQERRAVGRSLRQDRALRDVDMRARVDRMIAVLRADPFEPDDLRAVLAAQSAEMSQVQARAQDALLVVIAAMTPERRAAFAQDLSEQRSQARARLPRPPSGG